jgi:hypothetical protein
MALLLVQSVGLDDVVLSKHRTQSSAETAMRKRGGEPNSLITRGMRIVPADSVEVIECFGRKVIRPKVQ